MECKIISNLSEAAELISEWNELIQLCQSSIYDTPEYVLTAAKHYIGENESLVLFTFRENGKLVGIFPLYKYTEKIFGLRFKHLGHVSVFDGDCPDIVGIDRPSLWFRLYQFLTEEYFDWDVLSLPEQQIEETEFTRGFKNRGYYFSQFIDAHRYLSNTNSDYEEYFTKLSKSSRTDIKRKIKKLGAHDPPYSYETHIEIQDVEKLLTFLDRYVKIEEKSWKGKDMVGIGRKPHSLEFHQELLTSMAPKKSVSFWFLTVPSGDVACLIGYFHGETLYMAHTTFDPEHRSYSPGMITTKGLLEYSCTHNKIKLYDPLANTC